MILMITKKILSEFGQHINAWKHFLDKIILGNKRFLVKCANCTNLKNKLYNMNKLIFINVLSDIMFFFKNSTAFKECDRSCAKDWLKIVNFL